VSVANHSSTTVAEDVGISDVHQGEVEVEVAVEEEAIKVILLRVSKEHLIWSQFQLLN
jgi:hypothetical protein